MPQVLECVLQKEEEVEDAVEEEEEGREHVDAVLQELKMLNRDSVSRCSDGSYIFVRRCSVRRRSFTSDVTIICC